jgi:MoxR-like ATPase
MAAEYIKWGASPRAGQFLACAAKTWAVINGRMTPSLEDVKKMAPSVLRHRIITNFNADADGVTVEDIINDLLKGVGV